MASVSGGELVVRTLRSVGVETIFGLHGAHIDPVFQACLDHALPIVDTRHEAAAGHAAEGYARAGHRLGVALVTAGGGFTNVVTPIANAFLDRTPVLFLTGSGALRDDQTNDLQSGIDQVAIAKPVTKWAHRITAANQIPRILAQAIRIAMSAPRGPVLIDIPMDVLAGTVDEASAPVPTPPSISAATGMSADLDRIVSRMREAERPIIVAGSEANRPDARADLGRLAAATGAPVFSDYEGLGLLADLPDRLHGGLIQGLNGFQASGNAPDVVLLLGARFGLTTGFGSGALLPLGAAILQVDPDARELGRLQSVALGINADVATVIQGLAHLAEEAGPVDRGGWQGIVRTAVDTRLEKVTAEIGEPEPNRLHPLVASSVVASHVGVDTVVVADGALTYLWLSEVIGKARPPVYLCHGYLGSMGVGFGVAIGAQAAARAAGKRAILVTGDGAIGYSMAEFDTAVRHGLPLIVVVMNNRSWGATLHFQRIVAGPNRISGTLLENGRYHEVAAAFDAGSYVVHDEAALDAALTDALSKDRPACINVMTSLDPIPPEERVMMGQPLFKD